MRVLSLFDGISCAMVALQKRNIPIESYKASEVDPYAIQISTRNHPLIVQLGDVKDIVPDTIGPIDLLIGGSPCQDLSIAKRNRNGLNGDRSSLFYEYVRLLRALNPRWFILENVASMTKHDRDIISNVMGVQPILIDACNESAQSRRRLFWTNIPNITQPADMNIKLKDILETTVLPVYYVQNTYTETSPNSHCIGHIGNTNGQANRVYNTEGKSATLSANGGGLGAKTGLYKVNNGVQIRRLTPIECERLQGLQDNYTSGVSDTQRYKCLGNAFNADVIAHILSFIPLE